MEEKDSSIRRVAWVFWMVEIALALAALSFAIGGRSALYSGWGFRGFPALITIPFATMGVVILWRHPRHAIGWVFLGFGAFSSLQAVLFEYMIYGLVLFPGTLPGAETVAWALNSYWMLLIILMVLLLLLFPNGHLPSPRWRFFIWMVIGGVFVSMAWNNLVPGPLDSSFATLDNPYGLEALAGPLSQISDIFLLIFFLLSFALPLASLILRIRRSSGQQKQQFKWFVFAAFLLAVTSPTASTNWLILQVFFIAAMFFLPVAIGIAILRHRLYDIDLIVQRTLVYSLLSAVLGLIYFGSVFLFQETVRRLTGQTGQSSFAIVISTLGIAALFTPLRRRIQAGIDRRFYRRHYDAEQTLASFGARLREEVDLDELSDHLKSVVQETMQPESVSLWLKGPLKRASDRAKEFSN